MYIVTTTSKLLIKEFSNNSLFLWDKNELSFLAYVEGYALVKRFRQIHDE